MTGPRTESSYRKSLSVMETPYTNCDGCKAESIQKHMDGTETGTATITVMAGIDRLVSLCPACWMAVDIQKQRPEKW
jgi:hypothetical protein